MACNKCVHQSAERCCASGVVVQASQACPAQATPGKPGITPPSNPGSPGSGGVLPGGVHSSGCTSNFDCPAASTVNVVRTPIAPAGWSAGQGSTAHVTKISDENSDRTLDTTQADGIMTCRYAMGASMVAIKRRRNEGGKTCTAISSIGDGFCCQ
ncbi:MAG: hypothetical protein U0270_20590 [Labilithrix sp.]